MKLAKIAVDKTAFYFDDLFSYEIPEKFEQQAQVGVRVMVPFGRGNTLRQGMILGLENADDSDKKPPIVLKKIAFILDEKPLLSKEETALVHWLKEQVFCTYFDVVKTILPAGLFYKPAVYYSINPDKKVDFERFDALSEDERVVYQMILEAKNGALKEDSIARKFSGKGLSTVLFSLLEKEAILEKEEFERRVKDATELRIALTEKAHDSSEKLTQKQAALLAILEEFGELPLRELLYYGGVTRTVADSLVKKGFAVYTEEGIYRSVFSVDSSPQVAQKVTLNEEQEAAVSGLSELLHSEKQETALLFGVTGSGKTQVFLHLIEEAVNMGENVIMMVPEIALTPQTVRVFRERFGEQLAVLHSGLSIGERLDEYKRIKAGKVKIAIGTRSAVFAPFETIGLIVMDEEQEYTYKSDKAPRYHARDIAKFRTHFHNALLLLCSATPSMETFYAAKTGKIHRFDLTTRYGEAGTPDVYIVDMNDEREDGNETILSGYLKDAIRDATARGEQSILLLNRRGFQTITVCNSCRETVHCPHCSVALTFHKANGKLQCHSCGYVVWGKLVCAHCGGDSFERFGLGTQRAEEQIEDEFAGARILRMDLDTTSAKYAHEKKLTAFLNHEYDIMIGTQMVAKGLDFPNVTVVGVLLADQTLYANDFRSYEKAFSLLTQVTGRSGRASKPGAAYIQTYTPFNDIIRLAGESDYEGFFRSEIAVRKAMLYPPFSSFCVVGFSAGNAQLAVQAGTKFAKILEQTIAESEVKIPIRLVLPAADTVMKLAGKFRFKLHIKCVNNRATRDILWQAVAKFRSERAVSNVRYFIDMNYQGNL